MENPELYANGNQLQKQEAITAVKQMVTSLQWKDPVHMLDIGCGTGDVLNNIVLPALPRYTSVLGVDVSEAMIKYAKKQYQTERVHFRTANIDSCTAVQTIDAHFTHIISFFCLHWVQNQQVAFDNIYQLLKPGGESFLVFLANNEIFSLYQNMAQRLEWWPYMKDWRHYVSPYQWDAEPTKRLREYVEGAGLTVRSLVTVPRVFSFVSRQQMEAAIRAVNPFHKRMSPAESKRYIEECADVIATMAPPQDKGCMASSRYEVFVAHLQRPGQTEDEKIINN